jgi:alkanesulfonate monooxygenase SsuD/methylene tetrahydromethanopterin reductase-like flavin-dependent oxidoreductase (luciferase family)
MKFALFAHPERYGDESYLQLFDELTALVEQAEAGGFDAFWVGEHYGMDFTAAPNPLALLAHLAARTSTIRLVTGNIVAPFWHPLRLASEAAMVDLLCKGRLELGIARGAYQFEFDRLVGGMSAMDGGASMRELVPLLKQLWAGDVAHDGEVWQFPTSTSIPKPLDGGPPIWIAAREAASHEFAVAHGCNVCCTPLAKGDEEVEALVGKFEAALAANPGVARPKLMMLRHAYVVEREDQIEEAARAIRDWYAHFERWIRNDGSVRAGQVSPIGEEDLVAKPVYDLEQIPQNALVGTPDQIIQRIKRYEQLGIDEVGLWTDFPRGHDAKSSSIRLFIDEVMPAFR